MTGAGMMDASARSQDTGGDVEAAKRLLREKGMASADKRAGRATTEGKVGYRVQRDGTRGDDRRRGLRDRARLEQRRVSRLREEGARARRRDGVGAEEQLEDERKELSAKLGENIQIVSPARFERVDDGDDRRRTRTRRRTSSASSSSCAAAPTTSPARSRCTSPPSAPNYVTREDVPEELVTAERDIYRNSDEVQSKPEQAREKIVEGMINKRFFAAHVLAEQPWIHDTAKTVGQALSERERRGRRVRADLAGGVSDRSRRNRRRPRMRPSRRFAACC